MKAVCVALLFACAIGAVLSADVHRVLRASKQRTLSAAASRAESRATLDALVAANSQLLVPVVTLAKEVGIEDAALTALMQTVAVRNARFEAAMGLAANRNQDAMIWVVSETIRRVICMAQAMRPGVAFETVVGDVFNLPGSSFDGKKVMVGGKETTLDFIKLDADRSGPFLTKNFPANVAEVFEVVENSGNFRELLHIVARLGLVGEGMTQDEVLQHVPYSFRGLLFAQIGKEPSAELRACRFNQAHLELEAKNLKDFPADAKKKTLIAPLPGDNAQGQGWVVAARKDGFKVNPHVGAGAIKAAKTGFTNALYKALGIPEWSEREKQFFIANGILPADANDDTVMPWSPGAAYTRFVPHDANKEWVGKMDEQGLVKDSGPSGTTDEILQAGDYTSITSQDAYGACVLRDTASAGMHLQLHHSWAEVAQGATASDRATPAFSWEDPYSAWRDCPVDSPLLTAIPSPWPASFGQAKRDHSARPPKQIDHFAVALGIYAELGTAPNAALINAVQACDFAGFSEVQHPFRVADEPANAAPLVRKYICTNAKFPKNNLKTVLCAQ